MRMRPVISPAGWDARVSAEKVYLLSPSHTRARENPPRWRRAVLPSLLSRLHTTSHIQNEQLEADSCVYAWNYLGPHVPPPKMQDGVLGYLPRLRAAGRELALLWRQGEALRHVNARVLRHTEPDGRPVHVAAAPRGRAEEAVAQQGSDGHRRLHLRSCVGRAGVLPSRGLGRLWWRWCTFAATSRASVTSLSPRSSWKPGPTRGSPARSERGEETPSAARAGAGQGVPGWWQRCATRSP